jgi:aryl-alcohol dehydrogenase-like predicted oxidoreductase
LSSAQRLGIEYIDFYYQHRVDPNVPIEENVAAVDITLTPADLERIDQVAPKNIAAGDRYPDMSSVNR